MAQNCRINLTDTKQDADDDLPDIPAATQGLVAILIQFAVPYDDRIFDFFMHSYFHLLLIIIFVFKFVLAMQRCGTDTREKNSREKLQLNSKKRRLLKDLRLQISSSNAEQLLLDGSDNNHDDLSSLFDELHDESKTLHVVSRFLFLIFELN